MGKRKKKPTEAERADRERMIANAERTRELAERAQAKLDAQARLAAGEESSSS